METKFVKINAEKSPFLTGVSYLFSIYGIVHHNPTEKGHQDFLRYLGNLSQIFRFDSTF